MHSLKSLAQTCMSLAERRCSRLASCRRTASGSAGALVVTPALLVALLLWLPLLWLTCCDGGGQACLADCCVARLLAIL